MYFTTTLTLAFAALSSLAGAVPSALSTPQTYHIEITGLPSSVTNDTIYVVYSRNFFGEYALQPSTNKSAAVLFTLQPDNSLKSTTGQGIEVLPLADPTYTVGALAFVPYNTTLGTHIRGSGRKPKAVVNDYTAFKTWHFVESQYGASLGYVSPKFNATQPANYFPSYEVGFVIRK